MNPHELDSSTRLRSFHPLLSGIAWLALFAAMPFPLKAQTPAASGTVITIAGNGIVGFSGDGGPATNASMYLMDGLAFGPDGTLYISDRGNLRIRAVDPATGLIRTIAGNGTLGNGGNNGPATNATLSTVIGLATDRTRNALYFPEQVNRWVRKINLTDGIVTVYAGTGTIGFSGDGGLATLARLKSPISAATDGSGRLSFIDLNNWRVRRVDPVSGIITTIAGSGILGEPSGDGGPATSAVFGSPFRLTADPEGNVFLRDGDPTSAYFTVRRIDAASGIINTIVGGGTNAPGTGVATNMFFDNIAEVAANDARELFVATPYRVFKLNVATGIIAPYAGDGTSGLGNEGDPALNAKFANITALAVAPGGGLVIADSDNARIRYVVPDAINLSGDSGQTSFTLPWVSWLTGDLTLQNNPNLTNVNVSGVTNVGGVVSIGGNTAAGVLDLSSISEVSGDLTIQSNAPSGHVVLTGLTEYGCGTNEVTMTLNGGTVEMTNGLTLCTNATLTGSTTIDGSVTNNGTIEPGSSPGRLNITGNLQLNGTSRLNLEIGGYASNEFNVVSVGGNTTLGGTLSVSLINNFPSLMTNGAGFTLLIAGNPLAGTFANIPSGGTLTTTDGYARFTVLYAGDTTLRLTNLVIVDTDTDGLPDWWEDQFSLSKTNAADAALDLDGDGASNASEFRAGTQPNNAASVFRIVSIARETNSVRLTWSVVGGKSYRVQTNGSVTDPFADLSPLITVSGTGESTTNLVDSSTVTNAPARNYRVRLDP